MFNEQEADMSSLDGCGGRDTQPILVEALLSSLRVNVSLLFEVLMGSRPQAEGSVKCGSL